MATPTVFSNYAGNKMLASVLSGPGLYLGLHTSDPTAVGKLDTEVAGGGYARQPVVFTVPSGRGLVSKNRQRFPGMPAATVRYLAVWDEVSNGNLIVVVDISDTPVKVAPGDAFDAEPGDIGVQL